MSESARGLHLNVLMKRKFGASFDWVRPEVASTVGPFGPAPFDQFETERDELLAKCRNFLIQLEDQQISSLAQGSDDSDETLSKGWSAFADREIRDLRAPAWFAGGWGVPEYAADYDYWGKMEKFSLHEALVLSVGVEPEKIGEDYLENVIQKGNFDRLYPPMQFLIKRKEQFTRMFPGAHKGRTNIPPKYLWDWFTKVSLDVHADFLDSLSKRVEPAMKEAASDQVPSFGNRELDGKFDRREKIALAKLVAALAIDNYDYDPKQRRSPIPKEIESICDKLGLSLSHDTIRKYLKLGTSYLPEGWRNEQESNHSTIIFYKNVLKQLVRV